MEPMEPLPPAIQQFLALALRLDQAAGNPVLGVPPRQSLAAGLPVKDLRVPHLGPGQRSPSHPGPWSCLEAYAAVVPGAESMLWLPAPDAHPAPPGSRGNEQQQHETPLRRLVLRALLRSSSSSSLPHGEYAKEQPAAGPGGGGGEGERAQAPHHLLLPLLRALLPSGLGSARLDAEESRLVRALTMDCWAQILAPAPPSAPSSSAEAGLPLAMPVRVAVYAFLHAQSTPHVAADIAPVPPEVPEHLCVALLSALPAGEDSGPLLLLARLCATSPGFCERLLALPPPTAMYRRLAEYLAHPSDLARVFASLQLLLLLSARSPELKDQLFPGQSLHDAWALVSLHVRRHFLGLPGVESCLDPAHLSPGPSNDPHLVEEVVLEFLGLIELQEVPALRDLLAAIPPATLVTAPLVRFLGVLLRNADLATAVLQLLSHLDWDGVLEDLASLHPAPTEDDEAMSLRELEGLAHFLHGVAGATVVGGQDQLLAKVPLGPLLRAMDARCQLLVHHVPQASPMILQLLECMDLVIGILNHAGVGTPSVWMDKTWMDKVLTDASSGNPMPTALALGLAYMMCAHAPTPTIASAEAGAGKRAGMLVCQPVAAALLALLPTFRASSRFMVQCVERLPTLLDSPTRPEVIADTASPEFCIPATLEATKSPPRERVSSVEGIPSTPAAARCLAPSPCLEPPTPTPFKLRHRTATATAPSVGGGRPSLGGSKSSDTLAPRRSKVHANPAPTDLSTATRINQLQEEFEQLALHSHQKVQFQRRVFEEQLAVQAAELQALRTEHAATQQQLEAKDRELAQVTAAQGTMAEDHATLSAQQIRTLQELETAQTALLQETSEVSQLTARTQQLVGEVRALSAAQQELEATYQQQVTQLQLRVGELEGENSRLTLKMSKVHKNAEAMATHSAGLEARVQELEEELGSREEENEALVGQLQANLQLLSRKAARAAGGAGTGGKPSITTTSATPSNFRCSSRRSALQSLDNLL